MRIISEMRIYVIELNANIFLHSKIYRNNLIQYFASINAWQCDGKVLTLTIKVNFFVPSEPAGAGQIPIIHMQHNKFRCSFLINIHEGIGLYHYEFYYSDKNYHPNWLNSLFLKCRRSEIDIHE